MKLERIVYDLDDGEIVISMDGIIMAMNPIAKDRKSFDSVLYKTRFH